MTGSFPVTNKCPVPLGPVRAIARVTAGFKFAPDTSPTAYTIIINAVAMAVAVNVAEASPAMQQLCVSAHRPIDALKSHTNLVPFPTVAHDFETEQKRS